jgi:hypothetical protein
VSGSTIDARPAGEDQHLTRRAHVPLPDDGDAGRLPEVMLYFGNECNRACDFCCVEGRPDGTWAAFSPAHADALLERIRPDARIKLYGGEPTLHPRALLGHTAALRAGGYAGRHTNFSKRIQSDRLIGMLEADPPTPRHPGSDAYLNQPIWTGSGAEPIPEGRKRRLLAWSAANPGRLFLGHEDILPVGAAEGSPGAGGFGGSCARCHPTYHADGRVLACAFSAEVDSPVYALGTIADNAQTIRRRRAAFLAWIDDDVEPEAKRRSVPACVVCLERARPVSLTKRREPTPDPTPVDLSRGAAIHRAW